MMKTNSTLVDLNLSGILIKMIVNEYIMMMYIDNGICNFGACVMSETIKKNQTLTSLDLRREIKITKKKLKNE